MTVPTRLIHLKPYPSYFAPYAPRRLRAYLHERGVSTVHDPIPVRLPESLPERGWRLNASGYPAWNSSSDRGGALPRHVLLHRIVALHWLVGDCAFPAGVEVHHTDGDRWNADPANLKLIETRADHMRIHGPTAPRKDKSLKNG